MYHIRQSAQYSKSLKKLAKSFLPIAYDLDHFLDRLEMGDFKNDTPINGLKQQIYKSNIVTYCTIYYIVCDDNEIILLLIYHHAKQDDISAKIINEYLDKIM